MRNVLFFPISSMSLAHYFSCACLKPSKYFENKPEDFQNLADGFLLLIDNVNNNPTDCCLELVLTEEERHEAIPINNGMYLFEKPLPITRVKRIFFSNKEQKDTTITNIRMSTAFIPDSLLEVVSFEKKSIPEVKIPEDCCRPENGEKIDLYNRVLGSLALMKVAREDYMNFSENYIATLSFFNLRIKEELGNQGRSIESKYCGLFEKSNGFATLLPYLMKDITDSDIEEIAKKENQHIEKDKITRIINLSKLDKNTYIVATLATYGVGSESKKKKIDDLIIHNFKEVNKREGIALCYGFNRGYDAFTNAYGLSVNNKEKVKFSLNSQLDYYTIESVYQYVFNDVVSSEFPYLDDWCPKLQPRQPKRKTDYIILDELIIGKKKAKFPSPEYWNGLFPKFKIFGVLAEKIFEEIKEVVEKDIYSDIIDQLQESSDNEFETYKQNEFSLQKELDETKKEMQRLKDDNHRLQDELKKANHPIQYQSNASYQMQNVVAEPSTNYITSKDFSEEKLKHASLKYKNSTLRELKKSAKLKDDNKLIDLLLGQPDSNDLFSN